jgi:hypothetical protein
MRMVELNISTRCYTGVKYWHVTNISYTFNFKRVSYITIDIKFKYKLTFGSGSDSRSWNELEKKKRTKLKIMGNSNLPFHNLRVFTLQLMRTSHLYVVPISLLQLVVGPHRNLFMWLVLVGWRVNSKYPQIMKE